MARALGSIKTGGRKKGTPNRSTQSLQSVFDANGFDIPMKIMRLLPKLSPNEQMKALLDLMAFLYPKRKAQEQTVIREEDDSQDQDEARWQAVFSDPDWLSAINTYNKKEAEFNKSNKA